MENRSPILAETQHVVIRECLVVLNAVCPTSLDSHKFHYITLFRPAYIHVKKHICMSLQNPAPLPDPTPPIVRCIPFCTPRSQRTPLPFDHPPLPPTHANTLLFRQCNRYNAKSIRRFGELTSEIMRLLKKVK